MKNESIIKELREIARQLPLVDVHSTESHNQLVRLSGNLEQLVKALESQEMSGQHSEPANPITTQELFLLQAHIGELFSSLYQLGEALATAATQLTTTMAYSLRQLNDYKPAQAGDNGQPAPRNLGYSKCSHPMTRIIAGMRICEYCNAELESVSNG